MNPAEFSLHDVAAFPLVRLTPERFAPGSAECWTAEMNLLLELATPFVLLVENPAHGHTESHEDRKALILWAKRNKRTFSDVCKGIIGIDADRTVHALRRIQVKILSAVFGVPVRLAADWEEAVRLAWTLLPERRDYE
ncbi:hypothetical protein [Consotaella aegiceratis]|uniref:hypothetical protein n=1 Tax=Consotaella aegiceratis TaxID=3097961 RepID=UPI002F40A65A